jgi:hypothetical protein
MRDDYGPDPVRELIIYLVFSIALVIAVLVLIFLLWPA